MFDNTTSTRQLALIVPSDITVGQILAISQEDFEAFASSENDNVIWLRDGEAIADANAQSYEISQEDIGHEISVQIETKDQNGSVEVVQSASVSVPISSELQTDDSGGPQSSSEAGVATADQEDNADIVFETTQEHDALFSTRAVYYSMVEPMYSVSDERASLEFNLDGSKISGVTLSFEDQAGSQSKSITYGNVDLSASTTISGLKIAENAYEADVSISDVVQNLRHIVGLETLTGKAAQAGDADNDGSIGISDVVVQLRHIVGLADIETFDIIDSNGNLVTDLRNATSSLDLVLNGDVDLSTELKTDYIHTNDAPTVTNAIGDQTIAEDSALSFQFASNVFADVDAGDSLTYTAALSNDAALPSWLSFDASTRTFSGTPANEDVGSIDAKVTATDGSAASVSDTFAIQVTNTNDAPTGSITISGNLIQGQTLIASNTIADMDGLGDLSFQWQSDGTNIVNAKSSSYTLTQDEVQKTITVNISYLDAHGTQENVLSAATQSISGTTPHSLGKSPSSLYSFPTTVSTEFISSNLIDKNGGEVPQLKIIFDEPIDVYNTEIRYENLSSGDYFYMSDFDNDGIFTPGGYDNADNEFVTDDLSTLSAGTYQITDYEVEDTTDNSFAVYFVNGSYTPSTGFDFEALNIEII